ncbi:MAG: response regulator transcription factor [Chloroflexi bacterium]|nr:response regulator transcription factor [Chloroflexota bacterium]
MTKRVLVVDDHSLFRDGIVSLLEAAGFTVVGQAGDGREAVALTKSLRPSLVLMDLHMPIMNGLEALKQIREEAPEIKVVMLTVSDDESNLIESIIAGAEGYLLKHLNSQAFLKALEGLQRGEVAITRAAATKVAKSLAEISRQKSKQEAGAVLSDREVAILHLVADGLSNYEISQRVSLSENTVKYHLKNILQKLNAHNRTEAVTFAMRNGLLDKP